MFSDFFLFLGSFLNKLFLAVSKLFSSLFNLLKKLQKTYIIKLQKILKNAKKINLEFFEN